MPATRDQVALSTAHRAPRLTAEQAAEHIERCTACQAVTQTVEPRPAREHVADGDAIAELIALAMTESEATA
jgi:hypothetical protein